ncbi:MAG: hypothetical protein FJY85_03780 [Deltaproteobacteria bacterium]|nr:hypothetical protein [Deltaproteobacteria bacterium]
MDGGCAATGDFSESLGGLEFAEDDPFGPTRIVVTPLVDSSTPLTLHGKIGRRDGSRQRRTDELEVSDKRFLAHRDRKPDQAGEQPRLRSRVLSLYTHVRTCDSCVMRAGVQEGSFTRDSRLSLTFAWSELHCPDGTRIASFNRGHTRCGEGEGRRKNGINGFIESGRQGTLGPYPKRRNNDVDNSR